MLFDTRYFWAVFTEKDTETLLKLRNILDRSESALVSSISIYEVYKLALAREGKDVAELRAATIRKQFTVVEVSAEVAEEGARIGHKLRVPMADALIMATAKRLRTTCVTDDPHFSEVRTIWSR